MGVSVSSVSYTHLDVYKRQDVPCTLGDDGTAALRIEPNYLYEVKATFPQGEAEYAFYTIS